MLFTLRRNGSSYNCLLKVFWVTKHVYSIATLQTKPMAECTGNNCWIKRDKVHVWTCTYLYSSKFHTVSINLYSQNHWCHFQKTPQWKKRKKVKGNNWFMHEFMLSALSNMTASYWNIVVFVSGHLFLFVPTT